MAIGDYYKDSKGNTFIVTEQHSGFVWLRNSQGSLKQIDKDELKFYTKIDLNVQGLKVYHYSDDGNSIYGSIVSRSLKQAEDVAKESLEYNYRTNKIKQDKSNNPFLKFDIPEKDGIFILW